ncbi:hypothetical protein SynBIOSE41_01341 [Synechococcus sp. BIOS-E4-1]|nr:hypothetical protein SynBIOSE41_01341 [Synechococcus sp. BIOS-E4-1]
MSAVISASDLDTYSFVARNRKGNEHEGALPLQWLRPRVGTAWT